LSTRCPAALAYASGERTSRRLKWAMVSSTIAGAEEAGKEFVMKITTNIRRALALSLFAILPLSSALAGNIAIYGTGAENSGTGQADPNYELTSAPAGVSYPGPAYTAMLSPWQTPPPGLYWDNPFSGFRYGPFGEYDYQTTFDLTGFNPATAVLTGVTGSDNTGTIWLNGVKVGTMGSISTFVPFTITDGLNGAHFQSGINDLVFKVEVGLNYSTTGLMVQIDGTADQAPEPGSLALLGTGAVGLGGLLRRRLLG